MEGIVEAESSSPSYRRKWEWDRGRRRRFRGEATRHSVSAGFAGAFSADFVDPSGLSMRCSLVFTWRFTIILELYSYTLFRMFDDLVILAKGGLIVYLGAVKKVEEYFSDFGIVVPERVNPPDYFIDILEGIIKPPGIDVGELPLRWMLLNGYNVPPFMLQNQASTSSGGINEQPISGELWNDTKNAIEHIREHIEQSLLKAKDLSNRRTPGVLQQYRLFLGRVGKQRLRDARLQGIDYLILCLAGVCLGTLAKVRDESFGTVGYTYTVIAVSLLCKIGALRSFFHLTNCIIGERGHLA